MEGADNKELGEKKTCPICSEGNSKNEKMRACSCQSDSSASSEDSAVSSDKVRFMSTPRHPQYLRFNLVCV